MAKIQFDFGSGRADPGTFPTKKLQDAAVKVIAEQAEELTKYPGVLGHLGMREAMARREEEREGEETGIHVGGGAPPQDHLRARPVAGANSGCDREDNPREPLEWFPRRVGPTQLESLLGLLSDGVRPDADAIARGSHGEARRAEAHSDLGGQSGGGGGAMAYLLSRPYAASSGLGWNSAAQVSA